jgi:hypothetical protein
MKRSCSEWELLVLILSMATSEDEGEALEHIPNCMDDRDESSMKIAVRFRVPRRTPRRMHTSAPLQSAGCGGTVGRQNHDLGRLGIGLDDADLGHFESIGRAGGALSHPQSGLIG